MVFVESGDFKGNHFSSLLIWSSNCAGSINPVEQVVEWSKKYGTKVLVDACQSVPHMPVDVQALGVDFLVASSHKVNKKS